VVQPSGQRSDVVGLSKQGGVGVACDMERRGEVGRVWAVLMGKRGGVVLVIAMMVVVVVIVTVCLAVCHVCVPSGKSRESAEWGLACATSGATPLNFGSARLPLRDGRSRDDDSSVSSIVTKQLHALRLQ
jgi:hypothetical protein